MRQGLFDGKKSEMRQQWKEIAVALSGAICLHDENTGSTFSISSEADAHVSLTKAGKFVERNAASKDVARALSVVCELWQSSQSVCPRRAKLSNDWWKNPESFFLTRPHRPTVLLAPVDDTTFEFAANHFKAPPLKAGQAGFLHCFSSTGNFPHQCKNNEGIYFIKGEADIDEWTRALQDIHTWYIHNRKKNWISQTKPKLGLLWSKRLSSRFNARIEAILYSLRDLLPSHLILQTCS
eukprot:Gregarina_sp_Poly_1__6336@NODE_3373_length_1144_cov_72_481894_g2133_i0_p1_GENE_NODE_3373_length_1144_cov_72_481894_g2133_i0NODE_3373_length_1144_cov_72_481894_g2133_i0_p1_ORF_typecomplete_len238_score23_15Cupin_3/PF05899_12/1_5e02Cupin_3/PF05899_12/5_7_NODE_3373_length_1144_cov_72_481894_g2133_i03201033